MTVASSIITDAYREGNIIPMGSTPNANQQTEALSRLNVILTSTIGNEVGDVPRRPQLSAPPYDQSSLCSQYHPCERPLCKLNLTAPVTTLKS
jgi:hypothetical protein